MDWFLYERDLHHERVNHLWQNYQKRKTIFRVVLIREKLILTKYYMIKLTLREKCAYSELFWSVFSRIRTESGEILHISPYLVRMRENTDQNNSEYGHFSRSVTLMIYSKKLFAFSL